MWDDELVDLRPVPKRTEPVDPLGVPPNATSLEVLQAIYRNPNLPIGTRHRAARDAAPFEYPNYAVIGHARPDDDWAVRLDRAIERSNKAKLINGEAKAIEAKPSGVRRL